VQALVRIGVVLVAAGALAAACGGDDDDAGGPALEGTEWTLVSGVDAPEDAAPTLTLADGSANGFGGCNTFAGSYELDGDSIKIGPLASTMMACEEAKSAAEAAYLPALEAADAWAVEDGELVLSSDGEETLRYSAGG
jgi:heat shock protein HslJ